MKHAIYLIEHPDGKREYYTACSASEAVLKQPDERGGMLVDILQNEAERDKRL